MRRNDLDMESATLLSKVATKKRVMLFGIKHDQKEAGFSHQRLGAVDGILIANDLTVSTSLTEVRSAAVCVAVIALVSALSAVYR